jgi:hypothetical protein
LPRSHERSLQFSHGRFPRHFWGTATPTFESLRTTKCDFLVLYISSCLYYG